MDLDSLPCSKCGGELDTGFECNECGHDMLPEIKAAEISGKHSSVITMCGPRATCPDGGEHDFSGWEEFETEDGATVGSAVCSKCGHSAIDNAMWM